jgi:hypothetical protein
MCEEILPNLFRNKIPLPESPLKYLNSYIIKDPERSLIIDTGLNREECLEAMQKGLDTLGIDLSKSVKATFLSRICMPIISAWFQNWPRIPPTSFSAGRIKS